MPTQAIPLAFLAAVYPFGLVALLLLIQGERPKARSAAFVAGAAVCTLAIGIVVVFVLRGVGLNHSSNQTPRYGLRLASGVLLLVGAWVVRRRPAKAPSAEPSWTTRAIASSGVIAVFVVGMALYTPSPAYLSALEVVGGTKLTTPETVAWTLLIVVIVLITVEIPFLVFLFAPGWITPKLVSVNKWLDVHGRVLFVAVLALIGLWLVIGSLVGLL